MDITLPYLPDEVIIVDDMLGKVPKHRYTNHVVCDAEKFPDMYKETCLINIGGIGPMGISIMDPT